MSSTARRSRQDAGVELTGPGAGGDEATVLLAPVHGGRIASLRIAGVERLRTVDHHPDPLQWGCYPMVPWAGRIRHGRFRFDGEEHRVPPDLGAHAIHGIGVRRAWTPVGPGVVRLELGPPWPFGGHAVHRVTVGSDHVRCVLEVHAGDHPMPAQAGWHPWFLRPVELDVAPGRMFRRDREGIPDGVLVPPTPRPWDDCFTDLAGPPRLRFPDGLTLTVESSCDHWVVYDEPEDALCVEPQTGPPDGFSLAPETVLPGAPLVAEMILRW
jgi:aldose 1-epimerase